MPDIDKPQHFLSFESRLNIPLCLHHICFSIYGPISVNQDPLFVVELCLLHILEFVWLYPFNHGRDDLFKETLPLASLTLLNNLKWSQLPRFNASHCKEKALFLKMFHFVLELVAGHNLSNTSLKPHLQGLRGNAPRFTHNILVVGVTKGFLLGCWISHEKQALRLESLLLNMLLVFEICFNLNVPFEAFDHSLFYQGIAYFLCHWDEISLFKVVYTVLYETHE